MNTTTPRFALDRYNSIYDDRERQVVCRAILRDYYGEKALVDPASYEDRPDYLNTANLLTGAALEICGFDNGAHIELAALLASQGASLPLVEQISAYLSVFQEAGQCLAEDFENVFLVFETLSQARSETANSARFASDVHSWQGRTTFHLLWAAHNLLMTGRAILNGDQSDYPREKMKTARIHLSNAMSESYLHGLALEKESEALYE